MVRVLLDTSFLLPTFGVEVEEEVLGCLELIGAQREKVKAYYSPPQPIGSHAGALERG